MAPLYAGVLACLAFQVSLLRGWAAGVTAAAILQQAWLSLWIFAAIGYVVGRIADWTVQDDVLTKVAAEVEALSESPSPKPTAN